MVVGWLPHGIVSTEPLKDIVRRVCPSGWSPHPNFWAVAVDYTTGRRVAFGRPGSPSAQLPDAIAASCAIPGFYRDVKINGRPYVDGGVYSASNLDVLRTERLDLVLALNPMSSQRLDSPRTVCGRVASAVRRASRQRLHLEVDRLRAAGSHVVLIQPTPQDLDVMGLNLMSGSRRYEVVQTAIRTTTRHLRETELGERLAQLSTGDRAQSSDGARSTWRDFTAAAHDRWAEPRAA